ncbi:MAG: hypothetical protein K2L74_08555 [Muribaculaceae bacterium]|nr:hypothetical protein [Muribaculaceae bacterium]MDE6542049.1 hypothetical protein [Muribaculaceae bacterium]
MEIKNGKKVILTDKTLCLIVGIQGLLCGIYWIVRALAYDDMHLPELLLSVFSSMALILYSLKR